MGNKVKAVVKGGEVFMDAEQWEEVVAGLLRIIEVQARGMDALSRALEAKGEGVVPGGGDGEEGEAEEGEEEGGGEEGVGRVEKG